MFYQPADGNRLQCWLLQQANIYFYSHFTHNLSVYFYFFFRFLYLKTGVKWEYKINVEFFLQTSHFFVLTQTGKNNWRGKEFSEQGQ
jgi:hypothetical protein